MTSFVTNIPHMKIMCHKIKILSFVFKYTTFERNPTTGIEELPPCFKNDGTQLTIIIIAIGINTVETSGLP